MKKLLLSFVIILTTCNLYAQQVDVQYLEPKFGSDDSSYKLFRIGNGHNYWAGMMMNNTDGNYGNGGDFSIFTYSNRDMTFRTGSGNFIIFPSSGGRVGVGTTSPGAKFEVNGNINVGSYNNVATGYGNRLYFAGVSSNSDHMWISKYNASSNATELRVNIGDDKQNADKLVVGCHYWNGGEWFPTFTVQANGRVGIGTTAPDAPLTVAGNIHAREVKVTATAGGADFVFADDYALPNLVDVEAYVKENRHLPEIPSAAEMEEKGLHLAEMNIKLLQKVEELTLYMIEQEKQLQVQKAALAEQSRQAEQKDKEIQELRTEQERIKALIQELLDNQ